jgi:hypothetical protein
MDLRLPEDLLTLDQAGRILKEEFGLWTASTLRHQVWKGNGPPKIKVHASLQLFPRAELCRWAEEELERRKVNPPNKGGRPRKKPAPVIAATVAND